MASKLAVLRSWAGASVAVLALAACGPAQPAAPPPGSSDSAPGQQQAEVSKNAQTRGTDETSVKEAPEPAPSGGSPPAGAVQGLKTMLDDGSYLFIPYADDGLAYCSAEVVGVDGTRTRHRPADARSQCSEEWAEQDASKAD